MSSSADLPDLGGQRILVTGASGFVGRVLCERARALGAEVVRIDVADDPDRAVVAGDIVEPGPWSDRLEGCDLVVHAASLMTNNAEPVEAWRVNAVGTRRVLDAAVGAGVGRFVYVSSMAVDRLAQSEPAAVVRVWPEAAITEDLPVMPVGNPYTDTKIAAEHVVLAAHAAGRIEATIIRPSDVYGPGCRPWVLEPLAAMEAGTFLLPANGQGTFTMVYVDDLVDGIVLAAASEAAVGRIVQLGGEVTVTTEEYFGHLHRMLGRAGRPRSVSTPVAVAIAEAVRLGHRAVGRRTEIGRGVMEMLAKTRPVSNQRAHDLLGWWPQVDLAEGMARTEAWLREQGRLPGSRRSPAGSGGAS